MLYYEPPKWNRANTVVPLLLYICAGVCLMTAQFTPLPIILQVVGVASLVAAILLTARYSLSSRAYLLTEGDAEHPQGCIRVSKIQGERRQTLCDLSFTGAVEFFPHKKKKELAAAVGEFSYYQDFRRNLTPSPCYDLVLTIQGARAVLVLELDEAFAAVVCARVEAAKQAKPVRKEV